MPRPDKLPLLHNSRFYVLAGAILLSLALAALLRLLIVSDQLYIIRLEQLYGGIALVYWYVALVLSPLSTAIGKSRLRHLLFARRGIGVSAAYFALLHGAVALFGQLGGIEGLSLLPSRFMIALYLGLFALIVLCIMAATSFDSVVKRMTYPKWKLLHRLVYLAGIAIIIHIWLIGTHAVYGWIQLISLVLLSGLFALEGWRIAAALTKRFPSLNQRDIKTVISITIWLVLTVLVAALPGMFTSYHGSHAAYITTGLFV